MAVLTVARASQSSDLSTNAVQSSVFAPAACMLVCYRPLADSCGKAESRLIGTSGGDLGLSRALLARAGPCRAPRGSLLTFIFASEAQTIPLMAQPEERWRADAEARLASLAKPPGALGTLEDWCVTLCVTLWRVSSVQMYRFRGEHNDL